MSGCACTAHAWVSSASVTEGVSCAMPVCLALGHGQSACRRRSTRAETTGPPGAPGAARSRVGRRRELGSREARSNTHTHTRSFPEISTSRRGLHVFTVGHEMDKASVPWPMAAFLDRLRESRGLPPLFLDVVRSCSPCFVWSRMSCVTASLFVYGMVLLPLLLFYPLNQVHTTTNIFNMYPPASQPHHAITPARHTTRTTRAQQHTAYQLAPRMPYTCSRSYILLLPYQITIHFAFFTYIVFAMYME
jgi:hypothetical protein